MMSAFKQMIARNQAETMTPRVAAPAGPSTASAKVAAVRDRKEFAGACMIPKARIFPDPDQPRKDFPEDSLDRLARSLTSIGQLVPLIVRYDTADDRYVIIDGERRWRAAQRITAPDLNCVVDDGKNPDVVLEIQLVVNALREDVNPMEQARAWQRLSSLRGGKSLRELAEMLNYDHTVVGRKISLTRLPDEIQADVESGAISQEEGIALAKVEDPAEQADLHRQVKAKSIGREDLRARTRKSAGQGGSTRAKPKAGPATLTSRRFRADGIKFEAVATRKEGFTRNAYLAALEAEAAKVRAEMASAAGALDAA